MSSFVFTCGDINGIGPEIVIKALNQIVHKRKNHTYYFICPSNVFEKTLSITEPGFTFKKTKSTFTTPGPAQVNLIELPDQAYSFGKPTIASGKTAYSALNLSYKFLNQKVVDAVVTAPVSKTALHLAGVNYPGQTEMFADWSGEKKYVMTFFSKSLKVALYSIHVPLKNISKLLNSKQLLNTVNTIYGALIRDFGIRKPNIAILGLNPHAGEYGIIGNEEKNILSPFIKKYSKRFNLSGPFSSDAFFANRLYRNFDIVLGMYHDQVLIPFKFINQLKGVNYTAGLKIVRTSPDHGVGYDIAGKNIADPSSMIDAFYLAEKIVKNRKHFDAQFKN